MKRSRFSEEQIIGALNEAGASTADLARKHGDQPGDAVQLEVKIRRHGRVGGKRLKVLEEETAKLKKLLAESMLDAAALRELLAKKW